jgi:hypothetical protein
MRTGGVEQPPGGLGDARETRLQPLVIDMAESAVRNVGSSMDDDIDPAIGLDRRRHERAAIGMARNVGSKTMGDAAGLFDLRLHVLGIGNGARTEHDLGSRRGERLGDATPDALAATRDDHRFSGKALGHERSPSNSARRPGADGFIDGVRGKSATMRKWTGT